MQPGHDNQVDDFLRQAALIGRASSRHQHQRRRRRIFAAATVVALAGGGGAYALTQANDDVSGGEAAAATPTLASSQSAPLTDSGVSTVGPPPTSAVTDSTASTASTVSAAASASTEPIEPIEPIEPTTTVATPTSAAIDTQTTTVPPATLEVLSGLPQAAFPGGQVWPNALYENDILYLRGTVPSRAVADNVVARMVPILGEQFVVDELVIDPTVPLVGSVPVRLGNNSVLFKSGGVNIPRESEFGFTLWAAFLALNPDVTLTIVGHTDNVGSQDYNEQLALTRATVARTQIGKSDANVLDRIEVIGKGPDQPIGDNTTREGRQLNRRVEFAVNGFFTSRSTPA